MAVKQRVASVALPLGASMHKSIFSEAGVGVAVGVGVRLGLEGCDWSQR